MWAKFVPKGFIGYQTHVSAIAHVLQVTTIEMIEHAITRVVISTNSKAQICTVIRNAPMIIYLIRTTAAYYAPLANNA